MKKCPYCAEEIQDEAIICRFCNRNLDEKPTTVEIEVEKSTSNKNALALVIVLVIIMCVVVVAITNLRNQDEPYTPSKAGAYYICQDFINDSLKAPKTAEFPTYSNAYITQDGNIFSVSAYVDAENSFGAMIRSDFVCLVEYVGEEKWRLQSLEFE